MDFKIKNLSDYTDFVDLIHLKIMRIHIFGASGSGVTTLGKALSEKLNIEYLDSDDFF
ncbi:hypothetical protein EMIT036CA2_50372 [Chryseobacterium sp. IT-36CA2]